MLIIHYNHQPGVERNHGTSTTVLAPRGSTTMEATAETATFAGSGGRCTTRASLDTEIPWGKRTFLEMLEVCKCYLFFYLCIYVYIYICTVHIYIHTYIYIYTYIYTYIYMYIYIYMIIDYIFTKPIFSWRYWDDRRILSNSLISSRNCDTLIRWSSTIFLRV